MYSHLEGPDGNNKKDLTALILHLALCHTIIVDEKKKTYNAASPDELALVNAAKQFGWEFKGIDKDDNMIVDVKMKNGDLKYTKKYKLLNTLEFNSDRKRMSVIVEDTDRNAIVLLCKGADSIIYDRLTEQSKASEAYKETSKYVDDWANTGLRTLYLSEKILSKSEYD